MTIILNLCLLRIMFIQRGLPRHSVIGGPVASGQHAARNYDRSKHDTGAEGANQNQSEFHDKEYGPNGARE